MKSKRTVLVTGASGFIGRELLKKLSERNINIVASYKTRKINSKKDFFNKNITCLKIDLTNRKDLKKITKKIDLVIHLSARVFRYDKKSLFEGFLRNNVLGTHNLLEFCREKNVKKIIYASTKHVYGTPEIEMVGERYPAEPSGRFFYYGMTKLMCEHLCKRYQHDFGIKNVIYRFSPVFGPGQENNFLIPRLVKQIKNKRKIKLYGDGLDIMEYLYIDDCVDVIVKGIYSNCEGVYNIGPGKRLTLKEMVDKISNICAHDKPIKICYDSLRKNIGNNFILDTRKAGKDLGFKPGCDFEGGMNKMEQAGDV